MRIHGVTEDTWTVRFRSHAARAPDRSEISWDVTRRCLSDRRVHGTAWTPAVTLSNEDAAALDAAPCPKNVSGPRYDDMQIAQVDR